MLEKVPLASNPCGFYSHTVTQASQAALAHGKAGVWMGDQHFQEQYALGRDFNAPQQEIAKNIGLGSTVTDSQGERV